MLHTTDDVWVRVAVLGPIHIVADGEVLSVPRAQTRGILALLALQPGRPLSHEAIIEAMWTGTAPKKARAQVHSALSVIRGLLAKAGRAEVVESTRFGYRLALAPTNVDIGQFDLLTAVAESEGDPRQAVGLWRQALALFHGEPLADAAGGYVAASRTSIDERRLLAVEKLADVELRLGRHANVAAELAPMLSAYPYRERLRGRVMLALHGSGRQSEALSLYHAYRRELSEHDGLDPGQELAGLAVQILRTAAVPAKQFPTDPPSTRTPAILDDSKIEPSPHRRPAGEQVSRGRRIPKLLPLDVRGFAGRRRELNRLSLVLGDRRDRDTATNVVVISGMGGVGKTALAVHWAHRVSDRLADGQLYVNLRGFDPAGTAMPPGEAIRQFLDALAVPSQRIPADLDSQINLYRTLLADTRMLVVLDNARDAEHVRPLLPGAPGCFVLITSRNMLTSLVAAEGAHIIQLGQLSPAEAYDVLSRRLGTARVTADPDPVAQIITCSARLPLALAIIAANASTRPDLPLAAIADQLRNSRGRLDALSTGDTPTTDVRAVFSWSYWTLSGDSARLFRLLGLHPGPDFSTAAAASLCGLPVQHAQTLLHELTNAHLVTENNGRYHLHDLLRDYAAELARTAETSRQRRAAIRRMLDHYLRTAHAADRLLAPARDTITLPPLPPGTQLIPLTSYEQALSWFATERSVLPAAVHYAAANGFDLHTWQFGWALTSFFDRQINWQDETAIQHAAVGAAERLDDLAAQAHARRNLARAHIRQGQLADADRHLLLALHLAGRTTDTAAKAHTHHALGHLRERQGQYEQALHHATQARDLFRIIGYQHGQAYALSGIGWCQAMLGNHQQGLAYCGEALTLLREIGDGLGQASTWDTLGYLHGQLGDHKQALTDYQNAIDLVRALGAQHKEAAYLTHLGDTQHTVGNTQAALEAWHQALSILEQLDHPDAEPVHAKIAQTAKNSVQTM